MCRKDRQILEDDKYSHTHACSHGFCSKPSYTRSVPMNLKFKHHFRLFLETNFKIVIVFSVLLTIMGMIKLVNETTTTKTTDTDTYNNDTTTTTTATTNYNNNK